MKFRLAGEVLRLNGTSHKFDEKVSADSLYEAADLLWNRYTDAVGFRIEVAKELRGA